MSDWPLGCRRGYLIREIIIRLLKSGHNQSMLPLLDLQPGEKSARVVTVVKEPYKPGV